jgi:hypothetical protein
MKIKHLVSSGILAATIVASPLTHSAEAGTGPNPFSDCGIGAALFKNDVAATISNVIWDIGTTAVTSATASPETCNGKEADAAAFIMESYDNLLEDSAHGEGQHFAALMDILSVEQAQQDTVMNNLRKDLSGSAAIDQNASKVEKAEALYFKVMKAVDGLS